MCDSINKYYYYYIYIYISLSNHTYIYIYIFNGIFIYYILYFSTSYSMLLF